MLHSVAAATVVNAAVWLHDLLYVLWLYAAEVQYCFYFVVAHHGFS